MIVTTKIIVGILPVFVFLIFLIYLDSYKLLEFRFIVNVILVGALTAVISFVINVFVINQGYVSFEYFSKYIAPIIEESIKALLIIVLIKNNRIGFMVESAIIGFAIGAGFACIENIYFIYTLESTNILIWIIRGFGTAIMHGGATAIFAIISINIYTEHTKRYSYFVIPVLLIPVIIHSLYNHFFLTPIISTIVLLIILPTIFILIFDQSENHLKKWLEKGLDKDMYILEYINSGKISETKYGKYLSELKKHFPSKSVADMLCFIQLHTELAIRAKGILLMRESGFEILSENDIKEKFEELKYLEKSIGKTGKRAIYPILSSNTRDLWQLVYLRK